MAQSTNNADDNAHMLTTPEEDMLMAEGDDVDGYDSDIAAPSNNINDMLDSMSDAEILDYLRGGEGDRMRSAAEKALFNLDGDNTMTTETQPAMVMALVCMRVIEAAMDPNRTKPLIQVLREEYDKRMISYKRKGRYELLGALQANMDEGMDEVSVR